jgi:hypothetical protein
MPMRYASFKCGPWSRTGPVAGIVKTILERLLPQANPDFERSYQEVVDWWFELDDKNVVHREVAFNASGRAIAAGPLGENYGIFTDLDSAPEGLGPEVDASTFEQRWQEVRDRWFESRYAKGER